MENLQAAGTFLPSGMLLWLPAAPDGVHQHLCGEEFLQQQLRQQQQGLLGIFSRTVAAPQPHVRSGADMLKLTGCYF